MSLPILSALDAKAELMGQFARAALFSPSLGNSQYMRMAVVGAPPAATNVSHTHPGNEGLYTWKGEALIRAGDQEYRVPPGQAIAIPPGVSHQSWVMSKEPWLAICFYCDECPALAAYLAAGDPICSEPTHVVSPDDIPAEQLGQLQRRILITPSRDGVNFIRLGVVEGPQGARGAVHTHLGNECVFTLRGEAMLLIGGEAHLMPAGYGMSIPPATEHPLTVTGADGWAAVAAYCDDCPALKRFLGKTGCE
jgi:quercetin dioxygenase-like cupin family protein